MENLLLNIKVILNIDKNNDYGFIYTFISKTTLAILPNKF